MEVTREEYKSLMQEVAQNASNISTIMNSVEDQRNDTRKILSYLENDPTTGRNGLFAVQQDHENRIEMIEQERANEKTKMKTYVGVATAVGGIIMSLATWLFKTFLGK